MDPSFITLVERCAPGVPAQALAVRVRDASGFEPLLITVHGRKPLRVRPTTRDEAIALATQALLAGEQVSLGLTQIAGARLSAYGLTVSDALDGCRHLKAVAARGSSISANGSTAAEAPAIAGAAEFESASTLGPRTGATLRQREAAPAPASRSSNWASPASWNVYAVGVRSSALVYGR